MIDVKLFFTVLSLHMLGLVSPGPDFFLTVKNALQFGRKHGFFTALGFGAGVALHVTYCIAGVAFLIHKYPQIFMGVKILGAFYLIYIGITSLQSLKNKSHISTSPEYSKDSVTQLPKKSFLQGFMTNLLNPKATLFILGVFTSAVPLDTNKGTLILLGLMIVVTTIFWFSLVSSFFGVTLVRNKYLKIEKHLNFIFGFFFIAVGIMVILKD